MADETKKPSEDDETKKAGAKPSDPPWARSAKEDEEGEPKDAELAGTKTGDSARAPDSGSLMDRRARAALKDEEDEDEEEGEDEEDEDEEDEDEEDEDEEDEDEEDVSEDEADEEDEDEEDEDEEPAPRRRALAPTSSRAALRRPGGAVAKRPPVDAADEWIPDWLPWAVLIVLIMVGLLGYLGVFGAKQRSAATSSATTATATTTTTPANPAAGRQMPASRTNRR